MDSDYGDVIIYCLFATNFLKNFFSTSNALLWIWGVGGCLAGDRLEGAAIALDTNRKGQNARVAGEVIGLICTGMWIGTRIGVVGIPKGQGG